MQYKAICFLVHVGPSRGSYSFPLKVKETEMLSYLSNGGVVRYVRNRKDSECPYLSHIKSHMASDMLSTCSVGYIAFEGGGMIN